MSSILLSRSAENPSQSAFFRLKRLLNVIGCVIITGFTLKQIGLCCVCGGLDREHTSHTYLKCFDDANEVRVVPFLPYNTVE